MVPGAGLEPAQPQWLQDFHTNYGFHRDTNVKDLLKLLKHLTNQI